jgi:cysteine/O-acetylserine efflux protein
MTYASQVRFGKSYVFNIGVFIGRFATALMCALFTGLLYVYIPKVQCFMNIAGAFYMLFLAWKTLRNTVPIRAEEAKFSLAAGIALQFVNPKAWVVGINVMSSYVLPYYKDILPVIGFLSRCFHW